MLPQGVPLGPAPQATLPEHAGYNVIRMRSAPAGDLTIRFRAGAGSAEFRVTVVIDDGVAPRTVAMPIAGGQAAVTLHGLAGGERVYLTVAAWAWTSAPGEVFAYDYGFAPGAG